MSRLASGSKEGLSVTALLDFSQASDRICQISPPGSGFSPFLFLFFVDIPPADLFLFLCVVFPSECVVSTCKQRPVPFRSIQEDRAANTLEGRTTRALHTQTRLHGTGDRRKELQLTAFCSFPRNDVDKAKQKPGVCC